MTKLLTPTARKEQNWFQLLVQLKGSVILTILPRTILSSLFALLITALYIYGIEKISLDILSSIVPSIVLALLLVFRNNTAYDRFWEGRKLWGNITNSTLNIARMIWVTVAEKTPKAREEKIRALNLLIALAVSIKIYLRREKTNPKLEELLTPQEYEILQKMDRPPLEIAFWLADYFQKQYDQGNINPYQQVSLFKLLDVIVNALGGCDRIVKTPIPLAYSIHLRQLVVIYCMTLPFQFVDDLGWLTPIIVAIISFTIFGIEAIGLEIEDPFGYDPNDLPLDKICQSIERNINDLMSLQPYVECKQLKS